MTDRNVGHEFNAAGDDNVVCSGRDQTDAGGDRLVGADAGHRHRVCGRFVAESGGQRRLTRDVRGLHFLDNRTVDDVVNQLLVNLRFPQQATEKGIGNYESCNKPSNVRKVQELTATRVLLNRAASVSSNLRRRSGMASSHRPPEQYSSLSYRQVFSFD